MSSESSNSNDRVSIGRIPLKQVRVSRSEREKAPAPNPMNKLVPYLDLFHRLDDDELGRLAGVEPAVSASLRTQVDAINEGLAPYADLLPRLSDAELVRLTGASDRTIRFWRLCQPRVVEPPRPRAETGAPGESQRMPTAPHAVVTEAMDRAPAPEDEDAAGYVALSGAPFPGFDDEDEVEIDEVSLSEAEDDAFNRS